MAIPNQSVPPEENLEGGSSSLQDRIWAACADADEDGDGSSKRLHTLLDEWHEALFKQAAKTGSVEIMQHLLDRYGNSTTTTTTTAVELNQRMLEQAAQHGNAPVFKFLLQQQRPEPVITDTVRTKALEGGVEIWKAILDHRPELTNYDFGEKGDLVAMAAVRNNVPLLRFFLARGLDPNKSQFLIQPIIEYVSATPAIKPEILDVLVEYGATKEKSRKATNAWRNI